MGWKDLAGSDEEPLHAKPNVCPACMRPKQLYGSLYKIPPSKSDENCLNGSALASSPLGRNGSAIGTTVYCRSENLSNSLRPPHRIILKCTMKYLDGISDRLGCVSQHRNRSRVVVSSRNPQNNKVGSPPPLEALNIKS
jgi:hypothetical protein